MNIMVFFFYLVNNFNETYIKYKPLYFSVLQFKIAVLNVYSYKRIRECIEKQDTIIDILNFNT